MKKNITILLVLVSAWSALAQNYTIKPEITDGEADVLLIPFDPNYYMSDMDPELGAYNQLTSLQIREAFRTSINNALLTSVRAKKSAKSLLGDGGPNSIKDLSYLLQGIRYEYCYLETDATATASSKPLKPKGQVVTKPETAKKYMKAVPDDQKAFEELVNEANAKFLIAVNQVELKNVFTDQMQMQHLTYTREMRVHYSIIDRSGKNIYGGIAVSGFNNNVQDINQLIRLTVPNIADQISEHLPAI
jgi:hypothetical protein